MVLEGVIKKIRSNPGYKKCGMILYHNGIVRETSRAGEIRPNVKLVLSDTLEAIKTGCTSSEEVLLD